MAEKDMAGTTFELVEWRHGYEDEAVFIAAELDAERWEIRKLEVLRSGESHRVTGDAPEDGKTMIAELPWPTLAEIHADPEASFTGRVISRDLFDSLWASPDLDRLRALLKEATP